MVGKNYKIVTCCYGDRYIKALNKWQEQLLKNNINDITILVLYKNKPPKINIPVVYQKHDKDLVWGYGDLIRLKYILDNFTDIFVQIDMDVYIHKDITPIVELPYDFIISRGVYQPPNMLIKNGFVCCTGFYIAKPNSKLFLEDLYKLLIKDKKKLDQVILNNMLIYNPWNKEETILGTVDVTKYKGVKICVLPMDIIQRGNNMSIECYGYHWKTFIDLFIE